MVVLQVATQGPRWSTGVGIGGVAMVTVIVHSE